MILERLRETGGVDPRAAEEIGASASIRAISNISPKAVISNARMGRGTLSLQATFSVKLQRAAQSL
jgi:hypothetical protein